MPEFVDVQQMHAQYPETFRLPASTQVRAAARGDHVRLCVGNELFWVRVLERTGDRIVGVVATELERTAEHGLKYDDRVEFEARHVYAVLREAG